MTLLRETVVRWVDQRLEEMLGAPRMWGSHEAIELQALLLLEIRALALRPSQEQENPRRVIDTYAEFLRERYPERPSQPLFQLVDAPESANFAETLRSFHQKLSRSIQAENPFEHSQVAIKLVFEKGQPPTASAVTGYYEEFRRAARAAVRSSQAAGRAKKDIEAATDFSLEDALVTSPNGVAGEVLLRLGASGGEENLKAESRVRDALSSIMTLAEWANTNAPVAELGVDDVGKRRHTAVQALRLVPRRGIETVAVGGKLLVRSKPVEIRADHEKRFLEVVSDESEPEHFDCKGEIRAIDLDRGLVVLGKSERVQCFARAEVLGELAEVGIQARVQGQLYRPLGARHFVLAESITVEREPSDE